MWWYVILWQVGCIKRRPAFFHRKVRPMKKSGKVIVGVNDTTVFGDASFSKEIDYIIINIFTLQWISYQME